MPARFPTHTRSLRCAVACLIAMGMLPSASFAELRLGLGATSYFNEGSSSRREGFYRSATFDLRAGQAWGEVEGHLSATGEAYLGSQASPWLEIPEGYLLFSRAAPLKATLGRRSLDWNRADRELGLGQWEPLFRSDYVRPIRSGLTGAFLGWSGSGVQVTGFASWISIPERGSPIEAQGGRIESESPWFLNPPSQVEVLGRQTPIRYHLELPSLGEILLHPSLGLQARVGGEQGFWASSAYLFKPMNRLLLAYEGFLDVSSSEVSATLHTRILHQHLVSAEVGYENPRWRAWLSAFADHPVRESAPASWTIQEVSSSRVVAGVAETALLGDLRRPGLSLQGGWLRIMGGSAPDAGRDASGSGTSFETRYPFESALVLGARSALGKFRLGARGLHDLRNTSTLVSVDLELRPSRSWILGLGADALGSGESAEESARNGNYISKYRANDRIRAGVSYVF